MPQEIYNEGRVVGLSAWEIFKQQALGNKIPESDIPDEKQWLTSMIGSGASMILRVPATTKGIHDYPLPTGSNLSAAGVIIANPFLGECLWDEETNRWATKVTSYSPLIPNDSGTHPSTYGVPKGTYSVEDYGNMVSEFTKITDGVVFTNTAIWFDTLNITNEFKGDGEATSFTLSELVNEIVTVKVNGTTISSGYSLNAEKTQIEFDTAPENDANIVVEFRPEKPYKDIDPDFNNSSTVVRLYISSDTSSDIYILLTGFNNKRILQTLSGFATGTVGGSADTNHNDWLNGGMLGPEITPWASKIVFSVPSTAYMLANLLTRTIPSDETLADSYNIGPDSDELIRLHHLNESAVKSASLIDFNSINITDYYTIHSGEFVGNPTLEEDITAVSLGSNESYNTVVAWYPGMSGSQILIEDAKSPQSTADFFPPAIYAAKVTTTGLQTLVPLDTAAPGTVKGFNDVEIAKNYRELLPDNYPIYYNSATKTISFVTSNDSSDWSGTAKLDYLTAPKVNLTVGNTQAKLISLTKSNGTDYNTVGSGTPIAVGPSNNLSWNNLLSALSSEKQIDILGTKLHNLGTELTTSNTIGITNNVTNVGAATLTLTGSHSVSMTTSVSGGTNMATLANNTSIKSGTNFIEFSNGLRLYISATNPGTTNVPVGSIGIGWVNS